jgi:hypothetical protein
MMDESMVLRQLNYDLRIARNGLKIVKGQAHVVYQENQDLKREVDRLKTKISDLLDSSIYLGVGNTGPCYRVDSEPLEALKDHG